MTEATAGAPRLSVTVRPATLDDRDAITRLACELGSPGPAGAVAERLRRLLASPEQAAWIAEVAGKTVGWIQADIPPRLQAEPFAEIGGLIVDPAFRGRGVGAALLAVAERWAAERGVARVRVRSREERAEALAFYRARGFRETKRQRVLVKEIG